MLDTGVFIQAAHDGRIAIERIQKLQSTGVLYISAHTIAEFYRGGQATANESRLLKRWSPQILPVGEDEARLAGALLAVTRRDRELAMDALLVASASVHRMDRILTVDPDDLHTLRGALPRTAHAAIAIVDVSER